jgi:hypothetical protein
MSKQAVDLAGSGLGAEIIDPSDFAPIVWNEPLRVPVEPARLRELAAALRPASVLDDRYVVLATLRRTLEANPDAGAAELMDACRDALAVTAVQRYAPDVLEDLAWRAEGGARNVPAGSASTDAASPALSARIQRMLEKDRERRAGRRFGSSA